MGVVGCGKHLKIVDIINSNNGIFATALFSQIQRAVLMRMRHEAMKLKIENAEAQAFIQKAHPNSDLKTVTLSKDVRVLQEFQNFWKSEIRQFGVNCATVVVLCRSCVSHTFNITCCQIDNCLE